MNDKIRNGLASQGLEILKICVLSVLYEELANKERPYSNRNLLRNEIYERLGFPVPVGHYDRQSTAGLIDGILWHLNADGYAEDRGGNRWRITEEGVNFIEG